MPKNPKTTFMVIGDSINQIGEAVQVLQNSIIHIQNAALLIRRILAAFA